MFGKPKSWSYLLVLLCIGCVLAKSQTTYTEQVEACRAAAAAPQYPRTAPNRLRDPEVKNAAGWTPLRGARYDAYMSRRPGSGSLNVSASNAAMQSELIGVTPGKTYTFSAYMRSSAWPTSALLMINVYDGAGRFKYNHGALNQLTTAADVWQEVVGFFTPQEGDAKIRLVFARLGKENSPEQGGQLWMDDVYFGEGMRFREPPSPRKPFDGSRVRVDSLGNFELFKRGAWQPFFPLGIYPDIKRNDYHVYSDHGFNCIMFGLLFSKRTMQLAKDAVSKYNPDGMMTVVEIGHYIIPGTPTFDKVEDFSEKMTEMLRSPVSENVLMYYWDNEQYNQYAVPKRITETIRKMDVDSDGKRMHPIFMLQGNQGLTRAFAPLVDTVGDYLRDPYHKYRLHEQTTSQRFAVLNHIEKQSAPVSIGIISEEEHAAGVRRLVYEGLIAGVKGIAYYRDGKFFYNYNGDNNGPGALDVTKREFWNEWPKLRDEIEKLLPLIRQPIATSWKLSASHEIVFGTRDYRKEGYVFLLNPTDKPLSVTLTISGLPYKPTKVVDYFNGQPVANVFGNRFTVSLDGNKTGVYRLAQ